MWRCYFSLVHIQTGKTSFQAPKKRSTMTGVCVCPHMCTASNLLISKSSLESSYHCHTRGSPAPNLPPGRAIWLPSTEKPQDNKKQLDGGQIL